GMTLAAVVVCGYALLTKVFPATLDPSNTYARLESPFGYWNAIGLTAAMGAIGCMWLGARRSGHALLSATAYPAMGVLLLTLVLAYSRGALGALAVGLALWFVIVPLRLRGAALLIVGALGASAVGAWDFSRHALSSDRVPLFERTAGGHELGALIVAMVVLLALAGVGIGFLTGRRAPSPRARRRAGTALLAMLAVLALAFAGALAHSHRGFTGSISHAVDSLTNPNARTPPNTPDRLTAVASVRARYWKEALQVLDAHPALGAGAMGYQTARLRYRTEPLVVVHAHGFVVQTLADLGLVGLFIALALLLTWMAAAGRATHPFNRRWAPWAAWRRGGGEQGPGWRALRRSEAGYSAERVGLLSMACVVVVFGMHSLIDWTWYVPGDACAALLCAGWLAGRGALTSLPAGAIAGAAGAQPASTGPVRRLPRSLGELGYVRAAVAGAAVAAALLVAWSQWQPLRSEDAVNNADALLASNPAGALAAANDAVARDPLSPLALFTLAEVQQVTGHRAQARATLARAVREQPSNPKTWVALGRYDLASNPSAALTELQASIYLNPESIAPELLTAARPEPEAIAIYNAYVQALRAASAAPALKSATGQSGRGAGAARQGALPRSGSAPARSGTPEAAG
ncbi:MAG TPA: O-antigen ligase family protein, partial [Solirubrobacteraceae bacterium]